MEKSNNSKSSGKKPEAGGWSGGTNYSKYATKNPRDVEHMFKILEEKQSQKEVEEKITAWLGNTANNPYKGTSIRELVQMYKKGNPTLLKKIAEFEAEFDPRNVQTHQLLDYARKNDPSSGLNNRDAMFNAKQEYDEYVYRGLNQYINKNKRWDDGSPVEPTGQMYDAIEKEYGISVPNSIM